MPASSAPPRACAPHCRTRATSTRGFARAACAWAERTRPPEPCNGGRWLVSEAVLSALDAYLSEGGGSRGARAICDPKGSAVPITRLGPLEAYRVRAERTDDRARKTFVRLVDDSFVCDPRPIRRRDRAETAYFERDWGRFLSGAIFEDAGTQRGHTR